MIYFIRCTLTDRVKIGFAADPWKRLSKIQSDSPGELEMLAMEDGDAAREAELHAQFAAFRVRGEWFDFALPVKLYVRQLAAASRPVRKRKTWADSGLTDEQVAEAVGIARASVNRIRRRKLTPGLAVAVKLIALTGVALEDLLPERGA